MKHLLRNFVLLLCACSVLHARPAAPPALRLLTVGNSFADNMVRFLPDLAEAAGRSVVIGRANLSGCSLQTHWEAVEAGLVGNSDGAKIYPTGPGRPTRSLDDALASGPWDVITIQQASRLSDDAPSYRPYSSQLVAHLRKRSPGAAIAFHQTWAYRWDDPKYADGSTPSKMHEDIRQACRGVARELSLPIVPVGEAFHLASQRTLWTYRAEPGFDFTQATPDRLPVQDGSLHLGWRWSLKPPPRLILDAHHANPAGSYLAGCVLFGFLFALSPTGNPFHPPELTAAQAHSLQEIAAEVLEANREFLPSKS